jgi:hypothetical protein
MKFIILVSLLFTSMAFAQVTTDPNPVVLPVFSSLKDAMKDMSTKLKAISQQVNDVNQNASSEKLATEFKLSVMAAKSFLPKTVTDDASQALYLKMMDDTIVLADQLILAFHNNDNTKAVEVLNLLSAAKKEGHTEFK